MPSPFHQRIMGLVLAVTLGISGCGPNIPKRYPVSGTIQFADGTPVKTGSIEMSLPNSRWVANGKIDRQGHFSMTTLNEGDGAVEGEHRVIVRQIVMTFQTLPQGHDHGRLVDLKFSDYQTSPLKLTVTRQGVKDAVLVVEPLATSKQAK